jgi:hypothetical protein
MSDEVVTKKLDAQRAANGGEPLEPGTPGYWKVWGAMGRDIQPGDLVMVKYRDTEEILEFEVQDFKPYPNDSLIGTLRDRFLATDGRVFSVGKMHSHHAIVVFRKGTHNTLADSVH